jgi:hypothetical protein
MEKNDTMRRRVEPRGGEAGAGSAKCCWHAVTLAGAGQWTKRSHPGVPTGAIRHSARWSSGCRQQSPADLVPVATAYRRRRVRGGAERSAPGPRRPTACLSWRRCYSRHTPGAFAAAGAPQYARATHPFRGPGMPPARR